MFARIGVGILRILEVMGVQARIYHYRQIVHTFYVYT